MSCCNNIRKFNEFVTACTPQTFLDLFKDLADGTYSVRLNFLGALIIIPITVAASVVTGTVPALNENYTYTGKVLNAAGETITEYDCFEFKTTMNYV